MVQNRKKLVDLFIGNISNFIVHEILEKATGDEKLSNKYGKELTTSFNIAKEYREKINPSRDNLPDKDIKNIKTKVTNKVKAELLLRISKGYENINLDLVEELVDKFLKDTYVI